MYVLDLSKTREYKNYPMKIYLTFGRSGPDFFVQSEVSFCPRRIKATRPPKVSIHQKSQLLEKQYNLVTKHQYIRNLR